MANKLYEENDIQNIANSIRTKNGASTTYKVQDMAQAILDIPSGGGGASNIAVNTSFSTTYQGSAISRNVTLGTANYKKLLIFVYDTSNRVKTYSNIEITSGITTSSWTKGTVTNGSGGGLCGWVEYSNASGQTTSSVTVKTTFTPTSTSNATIRLQVVIVGLY